MKPETRDLVKCFFTKNVYKVVFFPETPIFQPMGIADRDYMRNKPTAPVRKPDSVGLWLRFRFWLWRVVRGKFGIMILLCFITGALCLTVAEEKPHPFEHAPKRILPTLPIKEAIDIAEAYAKEEKLHTSMYFITSVTYHEYRDIPGEWKYTAPSGKYSGSYWEVTYEIDRKYIMDAFFKLLIYMNREVRIIHGG